jgi:uncharacterized membrane protein YdjX (TVP38/TMEM64 family)
VTQLVADAVLSLSRLGPWMPVLFILLYIIATVGLFPGVVLSLAGGVLFGVGRGILYVFIGASVGASVSFAIARRLAHRRVSAWMARDARWAAIGEAVRGKGFLVVLLLRLSPLVPYNLLNYALGVTDIRFRDYALGSAGMLPSTLLYVYSGKVIGDVAGVVAGKAAPMGVAYYALLAVGLAATVLVTVIVTRTAHAALERQRQHP